MNLLLSRLDERQRRWYAGLEAQRLGHGGDQCLARITGFGVKTIRRGPPWFDPADPDARALRVDILDAALEARAGTTPRPRSASGGPAERKVWVVGRRLDSMWRDAGPERR